MTKHNHKKHEHCEHEEVAYCGHCQVVYCKGCKREWSDCKLNHGYTYVYPRWPNTSSTIPNWTFISTLAGTYPDTNVDLTAPMTTCSHGN